jgi:microcystin-dependent protein
MSAPFIAEVRIFAGSFAPRGWMRCDGQIMQIEQNRALFSLLGTRFGGDGTLTFGIPDLRDSVPIGHGQGQGLTNRFIGEASGSNTVALKEAQLPRHGHALNVSNNNADVNGNGASAPHNNMMPSLGVTFIIALQGVFPGRP